MEVWDSFSHRKPYAYLPSIDPTQLGARRVLKLERNN